MRFKSDAQRRAMFARMGYIKGESVPEVSEKYKDFIYEYGKVDPVEHESILINPMQSGWQPSDESNDYVQTYEVDIPKVESENLGYYQDRYVLPSVSKPTPKIKDSGFVLSEEERQRVHSGAKELRASANKEMRTKYRSHPWRW